MLHDMNVNHSFKTMYLRQPRHVIFETESSKYLKHEHMHVKEDNSSKYIFVQSEQILP